METKYPELAEEVLLIRCSLKTWTDNINVARKEFIDTYPKGSETWLKVSLALIQIALENVSVLYLISIDGLKVLMFG